MTVPRSQRGYPIFSTEKERDDYFNRLVANGHRVCKASRKHHTMLFREVTVYTVADIDGRQGPVSNGK